MGGASAACKQFVHTRAALWYDCRLLGARSNRLWRHCHSCADFGFSFVPGKIVSSFGSHIGGLLVTCLLVVVVDVVASGANGIRGREKCSEHAERYPHDIT